MSVFKEGFYIIQNLLKKQHRIYPDACDTGVLVNSGDSNFNACKQLCDWYGIKSTKSATEYETGKSCRMYVHLIDEWKTGESIYYKIEYVKVKKGIKINGEMFEGYIYIEIVDSPYIAKQLSDMIVLERKMTAIANQRANLLAKNIVKEY